MTKISISTIDALWTLERLAEHLRHPGTWSAQLRAPAHAITDAFAHLARLLQADDLAIPALCEEELVFRAARWIVRSALDEIEGAIVALEHAEDAAPGRWETWRRLLGAIPVARTELTELTQRWLGYRTGERALTSAELVMYRQAVDAALQQLRKLDEIPDVERLLYRGVAYGKCPPIARPCEQSLAALRLEIDVRRARSFGLAHSLWERTLGSVGDAGGVAR
jgi:hypothetical protein